MSLTKLFLGGNNLIISRPGRVWSVTSRQGTGKPLTFFTVQHESGWHSVDDILLSTKSGNLSITVQMYMNDVV
jgi:hypothetical protein